jgi:hypothetical protein
MELQLSRINISTGWAIHEVVFEYADGHRSGTLMENDGQWMDLSDINLQARWARWYSVDEGDYITIVSGFSTANHRYICHSLRIEFAHDTRPIDVVAGQPDWKGSKFTHNLTTTELTTGLRQMRGNPVFETVRTSIHLPLDRATFDLLPRECQQQYHLITSELHDRLGEDLEMKILGFLRGYDLIPRG